MVFDGETLTVDTGIVRRVWDVTPHGLITVGLQRNHSDFMKVRQPPASGCDWDLGDIGPGELTSLQAYRDDDERFTSEHLRVAAEFVYPTARIKLRYVVWVYPGAQGLRTQLQIQAMPGYDHALVDLTPQIVESVDLTIGRQEYCAFGLMQGIRTNSNTCILEEQTITESDALVDWANGVILQGNRYGVILVKESNKHIAIRKRREVETGAFLLDDSQVAVTGTGLKAADINQDDYLDCWATWLILYEAGPINGNLALKQFDRLRYPIDPERDIYLMANTWGSEDRRPPCLHAAREENVLEELESVADLGIDVLQIDDGWQTPKWTPAVSAAQVQRGGGAVRAFGDYPVYPEGWSRTRDKAKQLGVTLGLWAAWTAPLGSLQDNYDQADFKYFKLDFADLSSKKRYDGLVGKARELIKHSDYTARVNWDVTETATRMGYFSGREYGNVYLANRKTRTERNDVLYVPHKVLNDAWNLSKYVNLNKFQVPIQNVENVLQDAPTDAALHSHDYAVGIALMSSPVFFQETRYYKPSARQRIRTILATYKQHRHEMFKGYVFPVGDAPNNMNWTGFQNYNPDDGCGYFTIFRERLNKSKSRALSLHFIDAPSLRVTNLLTSKVVQIPVKSGCEIELEIPDAPGFLFMRYEPL